MKIMQKIAAYSASFRLGARICLSDRADLVSTVLIYATLIVVFQAVYQIMPVEELGRPDITRMHLLWYFIATEIIVVAVQGNEREFGRSIGEGQLTVLMQRPGNMMGMWLARISGTVLVNVVVLSLFAVIIVPLFTGSALPLPWSMIPFFIVSLLLGTLIFLLTGYCVGMLEIFGPYSRSFNWMVNKTIFTFGGLFFPVIFFPQILQYIVHLTPAPAILAVPGNFMLNPSQTDIFKGLAEQFLWLFVMAGFAVTAEKKMLARVLVKGD